MFNINTIIQTIYHRHAQTDLFKKEKSKINED